MSRSPLLRGLRSAVPLLAAQGVLFGAGFALSAVLLHLLPREDLAHLGRLREALRWLVVLGGFGLGTGLLRHAREHREDRGALLVTTWIAAGALSVAAVAALAALPGLRALVLGDRIAEREFLIYGWKAPCLVVFGATVAVLHAGARFGRMGGLESVERVLVLVGAAAGALAGGLRGLVVGSLVASALAAALSIGFARREVAAASRPARLDAGLLARLVRVGRARTAVQLLESLRPLVLLRVITLRGLTDAETGVLYAGMMFTLPLIAVPERLAQALYPTMLDEGGETADLDRRSRRLLLELAAVALPLLAAFGGVLTLVLPVFGGGEYAASVPIVWILLPGVAAHGLAAHQGYVILVRHRLAREAVVSAAALVIAAGLAFVLAPGGRAAGAAAALSAALVVRGVGITLVARRGGR